MRGRLPKSAAIVADGTATLIRVGFKPYKVEVFNETTLTLSHHIRGMDAASAFQVEDNQDNTADAHYISSDGITLTDDGFILGANALLNANTNEVFWIAY